MIDNIPPKNFSKSHAALTGLTATEALKKGAGVTKLTNETKIIEWFWEVFLGDHNRIKIIINKQTLDKPKGKKWTNITTQKG